MHLIAVHITEFSIIKFKKFTHMISHLSSILWHLVFQLWLNDDTGLAVYKPVIYSKNKQQIRNYVWRAKWTNLYIKCCIIVTVVTCGTQVHTAITNFSLKCWSMISKLFFSDAKSRYWFFSVDPHFEVSDPDSMACDDPKPLMPDPTYHVMILIHFSFHVKMAAVYFNWKKYCGCHHHFIRSVQQWSFQW